VTRANNESGEYRKGVKLTDMGERRKENGGIGGRGGSGRGPLPPDGGEREAEGKGGLVLSAEGKSAGGERETRARAGEEAGSAGVGRLEGWRAAAMGEGRDGRRRGRRWRVGGLEMEGPGVGARADQPPR